MSKLNIVKICGEENTAVGRAFNSVSGDRYSDVLKGIRVSLFDRDPLAASVVCK